jgi:benzoyl-CoA reductase/2-hydroxyglutaryl-CoA dehydratase subunit BcrC/BadD/HgdB
VTTTTPQKSRIDALLRTSKFLLRMNNRPGTPRSETLYFQMLVKYFSRIQTAHQDGKLIATHTVFTPGELLYAMDVVPMHTEGVTWLASLFLGHTDEMLSAGAALGLSPEVCSAHRGLAGAFQLGVLPRPDFVVWTNLVCDNSAKGGELVMKINDCDGFFIDHPFKRTEEEFRYLVEELKDLVVFLEKKTGRKLDLDKLSQTVAGVDQELQLLREIAGLRKKVPTPFPPAGFLRLVTVDYLFPGQPEAVEYLTAVRDELAEKVKKGEGGLPKERFRLMTLFIPPLYLVSALEKIYPEHGAASVCEPYFLEWGEGRLDPAKPLESVARKCLMNPPMHMYAPLDESAIRFWADKAKEYQVDGAVNFAHVSCRHTCATIKLLKDTLAEADVPLLNIDADILDETSFSEEELRARFDQFFEMLGDR